MLHEIKPLLILRGNVHPLVKLVQSNFPVSLLFGKSSLIVESYGVKTHSLWFHKGCREYNGPRSWGGGGDIKQRTRQCPKGHKKRKEATGVLARWPDVAKELGRKHQLSSLCGVSPILSPTPLICRSSYGKNGCLLLT